MVPQAVRLRKEQYLLRENSNRKVPSYDNTANLRDHFTVDHLRNQGYTVVKYQSTPSNLTKVSMYFRLTVCLIACLFVWLHVTLRYGPGRI